MSLQGKIEGNDNVAEISSTQSQPQSIEEAGSKAAFLATFTPQDDKDVMRKVDRRFLLLIGILYMTKNVSTSHPVITETLAYLAPDRLLKRIRRQSVASRRRQKHLDRVEHELKRI
jgi:hypothetical protein